MDSDTLYIKVGYILSTLSVDWSSVGQIESKQLFIVKTQNGSSYTGIISIPETPGSRPVKLEVSETLERKVELAKSEVISVDQTSLNFWHRFNGGIGIGSTYSKGNQSTQYNLSSDVIYPAERWSIGGSYNSNLASSSGSSVATRNDVGIVGQRLLRWNNWYYSGLGDFLQSSVQNIRLQNTLGGGVGRYIKNTNHATFTITGGFAWQQINYSENLVSLSSENVASALIASNLSLFYFDRTTLTVKALVLPALSDPGRAHFSLNSTYDVKLWKNIRWNLTFYGNWDNRPPPTFSGSDYGTSTGVSWTFGNR
ncbi:MAG TPA: DUF481 domain-containing protein [Terriglobales bacterium]|nr:DUF481 domain-containing protein [Terriglobales bacterium]